MATELSQLCPLYKSPCTRAPAPALKAHPKPVWPHLDSIYQDSLSLVTFTGTGGEDSNISFGRTQFNLHLCPWCAVVTARPYGAVTNCSQACLPGPTEVWRGRPIHLLPPMPSPAPGQDAFSGMLTKGTNYFIFWYELHLRGNKSQRTFLGQFYHIPLAFQRHLTQFQRSVNDKEVFG